MKKFDFSKSFEEVEIAGEVYKVDFSDDKVMEYQKLYTEVLEQQQKVQGVDAETASYEDLKEIQEVSKTFSQRYVDAMLGEGTFDVLYEKAGRSSIVFVELIEFLNEIQENKVTAIKERQKKQYVVKK